MHAPKTLGSTADFTLRVWWSAKTWGVELRPALTALPVLAEVSQAVNSLVLAPSQYADWPVAKFHLMGRKQVRT